MLHYFLLAVSVFAVFISAHIHPPTRTHLQYITAVNRTQPIKLLASPACGALTSSHFTEVNTGVKLNATKTIVAFGDSWTSNGSNGTIPFAPMVFPPNPSAGARFGNNFRARASNSYVWVENLANTLGAKLIDYAVGGAVVDLSAWNSTNKGVTFTSDNLLRVDFIEQTNLFLQQGRFLSNLDPDTTLYTIHFVSSDFNQFSIADGDWNIAANTFLRQIGILQQNGARNFLVHWLYTSNNVTNAFQDVVHHGLKAAHAENGTNFVTVNFNKLYSAILNEPEVWGYNNNTWCAPLNFPLKNTRINLVCSLVSQNFTTFGCDDPDHSIFYIPNHPSGTTHEIMSQYTILTAETCI
ncbi:Carbohydrate esterase family 16 protein [Mycena indigotica]|uniref:Carbohydrate esterase family 16 protein n=1 Tax=Mycena indigotica TaxID=2126181 RepID=A0A8H6SGH0_9AGAR|nr:Carbohydrate esterase family 16 protein [Mycena indigotica]KAF7298954.1 Carbohydrate esterase family 16 protein [Mycena indigotica]